MKPFLPARLLLLMFVFLVSMLITSGAASAPSVIETSVTQSLSFPWAMSGCWEHELFIPKSAAPVAQQIAP